MIWHKLWDKNSKEIIWRGFLVKGKFTVDKNGNPTCSRCNNRIWHPFFFGSLDVGYQLAYKCDCKKSIIKFLDIKGDKDGINS